MEFPAGLINKKSLPVLVGFFFTISIWYGIMLATESW